MRILSTFLVVAVAMGIVSGACVIADPPSDLPRLGELRPNIVRESVVPPMSSVLMAWPTTFIVPVELSDPLTDITWAAFLDYNPVTGDGYVIDGTAAFSGAKPAIGRVRTLELPIPRPTDADDRCHVFEIVVALRAPENRNQFSLHNPASPGGDTAMWFFNLSGDLAGCPGRDAGIVPIVEDAGTDSGNDDP